MLAPPGFYYVKKPKRFVILSSDKSSERNLSCVFDIIKPSRGEHSWKEGIVSSEYIFSMVILVPNGMTFDAVAVFGQVFWLLSKSGLSYCVVHASKYCKKSYTVN